MINRAVIALALAGTSTAAHAQTINITADATFAVLGDIITWTISVTGLTAGQFVQAYDFNVQALNPTVGEASTFSTSLSNLVGPTAGTPNGASIDGVSGGQSTLVDPLNATFGDVVLGTFAVEATREGTISYTLTDGGVLNAPIIRIRTGSDLGPIALEGADFTIRSDIVNRIPAPSTIIMLALASASAARKRRGPREGTR